MQQNLEHHKCNKSLKRKREIFQKERLQTFYFAGESSRKMRHGSRKKDPVQ